MVDSAHRIAFGDCDFASDIGERAHLSLDTASVVLLVLEKCGDHPIRGLDPPGDADELFGFTSHALLCDEVVPTPVIPRDVLFEQ